MRIWLAFMLFVGAAYGQEAVPWSKNAVLIHNFAISAQPARAFVFSAGIEPRITREKIGKTVYHFDDCQAVWYRDMSAVPDSARAGLLSLAQLYFDCYEFESRRARSEIFADSADNAFVLSEAEDRADSLAASIGNYTDLGANQERMAEMRIWMDSLLEFTMAEKNTSLRLRPFGIDLSIGLTETLFFTGSPSYFPSKTGAGFTAGIFVKRLYLGVFQSGGRMTAKADLTADDFKFYSGDRLLHAQLGIFAGCRIYDEEHLKIVPYATFGTFRITNLTQPKESLYGKGPRSFGPGAGFRAQWNFRPSFAGSTGAHIFHAFVQGEIQWTNYLYKLPVQTVRIAGGFGYTFQNVEKSPLPDF
jgi:hypothetical protein